MQRNSIPTNNLVASGHALAFIYLTIKANFKMFSRCPQDILKANLEMLLALYTT